MKTKAKRINAILAPDTELGSRRNTRLHSSDDAEVARRTAAGETESAIIRKLTHKGLAYERLENGAADPVVRQLLRELNNIVSHHTHESTAQLKDQLAQANLFFKDQLAQTNLFLAAFFASTFADVKFPVIEGLTDAQRTGLFQTCLKPTNQMLDLLRAQYLLLMAQANSQQAATNNQSPMSLNNPTHGTALD